MLAVVWLPNTWLRNREPVWSEKTKEINIPVGQAVSFWEGQGKWGPRDTRLLQCLVDRCGNGSPLVGNYKDPISGDRPLGDIQRAYVRIESEAHERALRQAAAEGNEDFLAKWRRANEIAGGGEFLDGVGYVAFHGYRPEFLRRPGQRVSVNLIEAAPGYINYWEPGDLQPTRIDTSFGRASGPRNSPKPPFGTCPTCFLELPASGECDTCV